MGIANTQNNSLSIFKKSRLKKPYPINWMPQIGGMEMDHIIQDNPLYNHCIETDTNTTRNVVVW